MTTAEFFDIVGNVILGVITLSSLIWQGQYHSKMRLLKKISAFCYDSHRMVNSPLPANVSLWFTLVVLLLMWLTAVAYLWGAIVCGFIWIWLNRSAMHALNAKLKEASERLQLVTELNMAEASKHLTEILRARRRNRW